MLMTRWTVVTKFTNVNNFSKFQRLVLLLQILIRKRATNNSDLRNNINNVLHPDKEQGYGEHEKNWKVLEFNWDLDNDTFIFEFNETLLTARSLPITKRNILKVGGMFFDPLDLLSPLTLKAKLLFQEACSLKSDRDYKVENEALVHRWDSFIWVLENLNHLDICRHVLLFSTSCSIAWF